MPAQPIPTGDGKKKRSMFDVGPEGKFYSFLHINLFVPSFLMKIERTCFKSYLT